MAISTIPMQGFSQQGINFRNLFVNGDMSIAQRATSVTSTGDGYKTCDRWRYERGVGTIDLSQSSTVPTGQGFAKSFKVDVTTSASPSAGDVMTIEQRIEGQNLQHLKKGTSSAESTTLSFWVRSTKTGTYICELQDVDNSRSISKSYTISSSDTWEKKTITFAGDTTGAFGNDNGRSLDVIWYLSAGSNYTSGTLQTSWGTKVDANRAVGQVNFAESASNDFYLTGCQLETGTLASDFEFLPHDVMLDRCYRYFYKYIPQSGSYPNFLLAIYNGTDASGFMHLPKPMRSGSPTLSSNGTFVSNNPYAGSSYDNISSGPSLGDVNQNVIRIGFGIPNSKSGGTAGRLLVLNDATSFMAFEDEL